jgi:hypothetical protein
MRLPCTQFQQSFCQHKIFGCVFESAGWLYGIAQGCTNPKHLVAQTTKFCKVATYICGSSVWSLLHVIHLAPRILRWLLKFCKMCAFLVWPFICVFIYLFFIYFIMLSVD